MAKIIQTDNICLAKDVEQLKLVYFWRRCKIAKDLAFPYETKDIPTSNSNPRYLLKKNENLCHKKTPRLFTTASFITGKT